MKPPADDRSTPKDAKARTVLDLVLETFPDTPRKRAKEWILAGRVSVAGAVEPTPAREAAYEKVMSEYEEMYARLYAD